ncbi:protein trichome birefringence-like 5 [Zingiber officinale]|uniref:protein trichome birefringence-like 5 n=1 Tax=Zingiber officinale TaxID=94328 RepID=UPI001C4AA56B|nr:protein trichome birefringence-like 5 [Zingiber officinale]
MIVPPTAAAPMAPPVPPLLLPHAKRCRTVAVAAVSSVSLSAFIFLCLLLLDLAPHRVLYSRLSASSDLSVSPSREVFILPQDTVDNPPSSVTEVPQRRDPHRTPPFPPPPRPFEPPKPADSAQATDVEARPGADSAGIKKCDVYLGKWERDEEGRYPLYQPDSCPYVDEAYTCQENGRRDSDYLKWKWKPDGCHLPRFNGTDFLERIRGKRLMFVGDSMNRNQFESMLCLLREALPDKSKMYETRGYKITKGRGYFIFKFADYDCTVEFVRSHFLAREGVRINRLGNSNPILSIDRIDKSAKRWKRADILVFNTGHWWTHGKTARGKNYYQEGGVLYPQFDATEAYKKAIKTWGRWIDHNVDPAKQLIIYRGYSAAHFRGGDWDSGGTCKGEREPVKTGALLDSYPLKMKIVEDVIKRMHVPVVLLNVTKLTNYRKDGHPSVYGKKVIEGEKTSKRRQDCSHWCLPGIPDAWNELIYATLVQQQHRQ